MMVDVAHPPCQHRRQRRTRYQGVACGRTPRYANSSHTMQGSTGRCACKSRAPYPARNTKLQSPPADYPDMLPQPSTTLPTRQRPTLCGERVRKQRERAYLTAKLQTEAKPTVTRNHGPEDAVESIDPLVAGVFEAPDELESTEAGHAVERFREVRVDRAAVGRLQALDLARRPTVLCCVCARACVLLFVIGETCDAYSLDPPDCHTVATPA
jgi:hypothetical protein